LSTSRPPSSFPMLLVSLFVGSWTLATFEVLRGTLILHTPCCCSFVP
jgi:hypothetical protein